MNFDDFWKITLERWKAPQLCETLVKTIGKWKES
jgi:hypothetical protein